MNSISTIRRRAAAIAAVAATAAVAAAGVAVAPSTAEATTPGAAAESRQASRTTLTFEAPGCDGCTVRLVHARWDEDAEYGFRKWQSRRKTVEGGVVRYTVPTRRTHGMSMLVRAPWEGHLAAQTTVAFRYQGFEIGDRVRFREARDQRRASACWAGTRGDAVTVPLVIRKVRVDGMHERVDGSIAFAKVTQDWMPPMRRVFEGVMGSQDVNICGRP